MSSEGGEKQYNLGKKVGILESELQILYLWPLASYLLCLVLSFFLFKAKVPVWPEVMWELMRSQ